MNLESLLSGIFALSLPAWLLIEQLIHALTRTPRSHAWPSTGKEEAGALRRAA